MTAPPYVPQQPDREGWDVVVVGTGMGGATLGFALARGGHRVLFIEKGRLRDKLSAEGVPAARVSDQSDNGPEARLARGQWPLKIEGITNAGKVEFFPPLGCGAGGSTALYAAALERFQPLDFRPRANFCGVGDSTLPETWPISYDDLAPYYDEAERLYRVCGTPDPLAGSGTGVLRAPPPPSARDQHFLDSWSGLGLHPYRIHMGCEFVPDCEQCLGVLCARDCKSDSNRICLRPALEQWGAKILPECEVLRLEAGPNRVERIVCRWKDREISISAKVVVLAAGAWMTPTLLLRSRSASWPDGIANRSGLVGRNLMLHAGDLIAVFPRRRTSVAGPDKAIALNDFYFRQGRKLGTFQSLTASGIEWGTVLWYLRSVADRERRWWRRLSRPMLPAVALLATSYFKTAEIFATIVEDLPYRDNRVLPDDGAQSGFRFTYHFTDELRERIDLFRRLLAESLSPHRVAVLPVEDLSNYGHACGTCRFGEDPAQSVLDRYNRAHDLENLYVVDSSFFPSSGGTNPSLTIAANALRVADFIGGRVFRPDSPV